MAIPKGHRANFDTMKRAAGNGDLALMECTDAATGEPVFVVCMTQREDDGAVSFVPVARMFDGNPYDEVLPPSV